MWRLSLLIGRALVFRDHGRKKEKLRIESVQLSGFGQRTCRVGDEKQAARTKKSGLGERLRDLKPEADTISGDNSEGVPPVPIPNTEVKPFSVDGTWLETARESRSLPDSNRESEKLSQYSSVAQWQSIRLLTEGL